MLNNEWNLCLPEHVLGHAAEYDLPQPGPAVSAHQQQV